MNDLVRTGICWLGRLPYEY